MHIVRTSSAEWQGTLKEGGGLMRLGSGAFEGSFSFGSRFESASGTNPEELIGAAQAGCFSMFLSALLSEAGFAPKRIHTTARVHLGEGPTVTLIELECEAEVPGIRQEAFLQHAENAKQNCPISKALAGPEIRLQARLTG
ncbi:MAG: OsmC family protein [Anaerolineae bacterium]|nr:OsmC family protein [Anaerolineae bacterium]